jgi:hypothetical protein
MVPWLQLLLNLILNIVFVYIYRLNIQNETFLEYFLVLVLASLVSLAIAVFVKKHVDKRNIKRER